MVGGVLLTVPAAHPYAAPDERVDVSTGGSMVEYRQFIGGQWVDATNGGTWELIDPATEATIRTVPFGTRDDATAAIEAAVEAFPAWSRATAYERAAVLRRAADLVRERLDALGEVTSRESGKPLLQGKGEWVAAADLLEWYGEEAKRSYGRIIPSRVPGKRMMVLHQPVGVVGTITAWNFPAYNVARSVAAALAAGCTVVSRPSEFTPMTCMDLATVLAEAGLPDGVFNVVNGDPEGMGQAMLEHEALRKLHFTGSVRVGKLLMDGASTTVTRLSLELGGNAPVIVLPDADMEAVAAGAVTAKYRNAGQVCVSPQRFLIGGARRDEFVERVVPLVEKLRVGPGTDPDTEVGPMINARQRDAWRASSPTPRDGAPPWPRVAGVPPTARRAGSSRPPWSPTSPPSSPCTTRSCSARSCRSSPSVTSMRPSPWPTTPPTAWPPTSGPTTCARPCGRRSDWSSAWSG